MLYGLRNDRDVLKLAPTSTCSGELEGTVRFAGGLLESGLQRTHRHPLPPG